MTIIHTTTISFTLLGIGVFICKKKHNMTQYLKNKKIFLPEWWTPWVSVRRSRHSMRRSRSWQVPLSWCWKEMSLNNLGKPSDGWPTGLALEKPFFNLSIHQESARFSIKIACFISVNRSRNTRDLVCHATLSCPALPILP